MNSSIKVKEYLSEENDQLFKIVDKIIAENSKIHISAPVGKGKTTFAIDLVNHVDDDYKFLFLFPIIAISEQVQYEMKERDIDAEVYNSKVKFRDLVGSKVMLSTIDSAHKLINEYYTEDDKVIIILDETHTYLQSARRNFSKSVEAILNSKYPIIGLSATPSVWVNHYLFGIEEFIDVNVTEYSAKQINPIEIESGLVRYIGEIIGKSNKKWVVFLERKKDQKKLGEIIQEFRVKKEVVILNSETKIGSEKKVWKHLMKEEELHKKVKVAIMNSVAQAGINIKNKDIDHVILIGRHDPFGVAQFLGRCREYSGSFDFYFNPGGKYVPNNIQATDIQSRINLINGFLYFKNSNYHQNLKDMLELMGESIMIDSNNSIAADKCMVATKIYSVLREAPGRHILSQIETIFPKDIIINTIQTSPGISGSTSKQRKSKLQDYRKELVKMIAKNYSVIMQLNFCIDNSSTYEDALEMIKEPAKNMLESRRINKPWFNNRGDAKRIRKIIKLAENAERSMSRIIIAADLYEKAGKKRNVLKKYIMTSEKAIKNLYDAQKLFEIDIKNNNLILYIIDELEDMIGQVKDTDSWKQNLNSIIGKTYKADEFVDIIFNSCLQLKNKDAYPSGKREIHRELVGVNKSFQDYLDYKGVLKDYIPTT